MPPDNRFLLAALSLQILFNAYTLTKLNLLNRHTHDQFIDDRPYNIETSAPRPLPKDKASRRQTLKGRR